RESLRVRRPRGGGGVQVGHRRLHRRRGSKARKPAALRAEGQALLRSSAGSAPLAPPGTTGRVMRAEPIERIRGIPPEVQRLHQHIDVVYADRRYWTVDPFGGVIAAGYLYGRGAIDMKSTGILHLAAMLALKRAGIPLKRDLVFLATADEEAGSEFGAQFIAD